MKKIKFSPPLPKAHQDSLEKIRMGLLETVAMEFYDDLFEGPSNLFLYIGTGHGPHLSYLIKPAGRNVAIAYLGGDELDAIAANTERVVAAAIAPLARLYQFDVDQELRRTMRSNWTRDADIMGALSYVPVGHSGVRADLRQSVDEQLFFAGEATSLTAAGSLHGAYEEGHRGADEILRALRSGATTRSPPAGRL